MNNQATNEAESIPEAKLEDLPMDEEQQHEIKGGVKNAALD